MATGSQGVSGLAQRVSGWFSDHQAINWWMSVLRLGLFQLGMGVALAPITGTLNRVLIGDMRISATLVASLMAIHYFVSPVRAVFGYRSDVERARGRWRTPYVALGLVLTYGGLATAPFSLILLGPGSSAPFVIAFTVCVAIFSGIRHRRQYRRNDLSGAGQRYYSAARPRESAGSTVDDAGRRHNRQFDHCRRDPRTIFAGAVDPGDAGFGSHLRRAGDNIAAGA